MLALLLLSTSSRGPLKATPILQFVTLRVKWSKAARLTFVSGKLRYELPGRAPSGSRRVIP
jgi:hypothetical protein